MYHKNKTNHRLFSKLEQTMFLYIVQSLMDVYFAMKRKKIINIMSCIKTWLHNYGIETIRKIGRCKKTYVGCPINL